MPWNAGVVSLVELPPAGFVSDTIGAVVSTLNVTAELKPVFPAPSDCSAWTV